MRLCVSEDAPAEQKAVSRGFGWELARMLSRIQACVPASLRCGALSVRVPPPFLGTVKLM
jgi:hypothetical protein